MASLNKRNELVSLCRHASKWHVLKPGLDFVDYGLWTVDYGLWTMDCFLGVSFLKGVRGNLQATRQT